MSTKTINIPLNWMEEKRFAIAKAISAERQEIA